ncbi:MAG: hypothetical protein MJD61_16495, partial [Proteobacteria bacterium]|nr:hypothetical protein [Pseudomonadota bacterium]
SSVSPALLSGAKAHGTLAEPRRRHRNPILAWSTPVSAACCGLLRLAACGLRLAAWSRALTRAQRQRITAGNLRPGDVTALRKFICLTQEQFAEALGISVHTLRNWEQDRVTPDGPGLALLRTAARHPRTIRES